MFRKLFNHLSPFKTDKAEFIPSGNSEKPNTPPNADEKPIVRFGMTTLIVGFGGFMLWAALAPLDEGVPGTGVVSVDTKRKTIQHLKGGIVEVLHVREGDRVKAGDKMISLNDTDIKAQLDIVLGQYSVARAVEARLLAERDGKASVTFPAEQLELAKADSRAAEAIAVQGKLFSARKAALVSELGMMDETIIGLEQQIKGLESIETGKKTQIGLMTKELDSYRGLAEEGFIPRNKLYELERSLADLSGTRGSDLAQIARSRAAISETKLRKLQRQQDFRKEIETQMADTQREVGTQHDRLTALKEEFERSVIKAPTDGFVVGLEASTIGGIIRPGDRIMDIIPEGDVLVIEAQLPVNLIDKIQIGQLANLSLQIVSSGGAQPVIEGKLTKVSADRLTDPKTGMPHYTARIEITPNGEETLRKNKIKPQPGMQADVVIKTGERTLLEYLLKPLISRLNSGMREQ